MTNIIIADNQFITSSGWKYLLASNNKIIVISEANCKKELLSLLENNINSLVILDYTLFDFGSLNELLIIQQRFDKVQWLLFSDELSEDLIKSVLLNSSSVSILMKDSSHEEINTALKEVLNNKRFICNHVSNLLLTSNTNLLKTQNQRQLLTLTEQEILKEMALGRTTKEIASLRFISVHTVMTHRKNIFRKIEVNNIHEATKYAMRVGIVDMTEYYI